MGYIIKQSNIESGEWTPTFFAPSGAVSNPILTKAYYTKVENIVTCTIFGGADFNFTFLTQGDISTSLPVQTTLPSAIGVGTISQGWNINSYMDSGIKIRFESNDNTINTGISFFIIFQYEIN